MHLTIKGELAREAAEKIGGEVGARLVKNLDRYGSDKTEVPVRWFEPDDLAVLKKLAKDRKETNLASQITAFEQLEADPETKTYHARNMRYMPAAIKSWIQGEGFIDGWMYEACDGEPMLPWLLSEVRYYPNDPKNDQAQHVTVSFTANHVGEGSGRRRGGGGAYNSVTFWLEDVQGKTLAEAFAGKRMFRETPELATDYEHWVELFRTFRPMRGKQFLASGNARMPDRWRSAVPTPLHNATKVINDEDLIERNIVDRTTISWFEGTSRWQEDEDRDENVRVPFHCYIYMFALERHENIWVHVTNLQVYEYDTSMRDNLVLPADQTDLIDILVDDVEVMTQADIIEGKSEGTMIICRGEPGLGKTLTAEVYSEAIERPLYKIPAGLLGTSPGKVEENLKTVLERAARWGAIPLIDEADVYIRRRGDDLDHNAVVAV